MQSLTQIFNWDRDIHLSYFIKHGDIWRYPTATETLVRKSHGGIPPGLSGNVVGCKQYDVLSKFLKSAYLDELWFGIIRYMTHLLFPVITYRWLSVSDVWYGVIWNFQTWTVEKAVMYSIEKDWCRNISARNARMETWLSWYDFRTSHTIKMVLALLTARRTSGEQNMRVQ